jgi:hypothetical protein
MMAFMWRRWPLHFGALWTRDGASGDGSRIVTVSRGAKASLVIGGTLSIGLAAHCSPGGDRPPTLAGGGDDIDATTPAVIVDASLPLDAAQGPLDAAQEPLDVAREAATSPATGDATIACAGDAGNPITSCDSGCVDTQTDVANCGGCGQACAMTGASCIAGKCQCASPRSVCSNACVDTTTDPSHCGFCGHNCQGNACTASLCLASSVAAQVTTGKIGGIAVDSTTVYWTESSGGSGGAYGKPIAGGTVASFGSSPDPRGIAVDLSHVYWTDFANGSINAARLLGGNAAQILPAISDAGDTTGPTAITSDPQNVYWVDSVSGTVNQMPLDGGPPQILADHRLQPIAIAVDMNNVYWVDLGTSGSDGSVNKVPIGGDAGAVTPLAPGEPQPSGIAVDKANVYWTDKTGTVKSIPINGGTITPIAKNQGAPMGIAVDSQSVYWTNFNDNTVMMAPIDGGTPNTLASEQNNPSAIAVDDKNVYWADQGSGSILKVSK